MMTTWIIAGFCVLVAALIFWPKHGLIGHWREARRLSSRVLREDALKHVLKAEVNGEWPTIHSLAGALQIKPNRVAQLLGEMEARGFVSYAEGKLRLRKTGRDLALHIIRAHRLWESYLAEQTGVAEAEWHQRAEKKEHLLSPKQAADLAAQLGHPTHDPHGDAIPAADGELRAERGESLNSVSVGTPVRITHIEDEPEAVYAQLCAQGLRAGMRICVLEKTGAGIRFWADGAEHVLAPLLADNISVTALTGLPASDLFEEHYLSGLKPGERATVLGLSPACRGSERRRLLDLGFVAGTPVAIELVSPAGDPTAYLVRGTMVALRREQAGLIRISKQQALAA
ncbi:MAG: iron dependent repressor, metal binding and dimerization domain protein [Verrucomicrobiota bacterium]